MRAKSWAAPLVAALVTLALFVPAAPAAADDFPSRPITVLSPLAANDVAHGAVDGYTLWHLIVAQSGTPRPIVDKPHDPFQEAIKSPDIWQQMITMGLIPVDTPSADELQYFVKSEIGHWGDLVRKIGIAGTE